MLFKPFDLQASFLKSRKRIRCLFAAKRSGKSEVAYIDTIVKAETQPGYTFNGRDPYIIGIVAPSERMLRRLVWPKFREFSAPFEQSFNKSDHVMHWKSNNTQVMGFTAEKIQRMEGFKIHHIHMTEAFQMGNDVLLESLARLSDTQGSLTIDGSLGPNIPNPKAHWLYKTFKDKKFAGARVWEWGTAQNPHFPKDELLRLKDTLAPRDYRAMFEIDWNTSGSSLVYEDFDEGNIIRGYQYNKELETYVSIDWGWTHPVGCTFYQYDRKNDTLYLFDEIVQSKLTLDKLWDQIQSKGYRIHAWVCDIAGNQEREQTGRSNVQWFAAPPRNISFKYRTSTVNYGISIVRQWVKNGMGQRRLKVDEIRCPRALDGIKNYSYQEKDGQIINENPIKKDDDAVDSLRYLMVNLFDHNVPKNTFNTMDRWKL